MQRSLVTVNVSLQNKTSDKTLEVWIYGPNPNWSGNEDTELRVSGVKGAQLLQCEIRGGCATRSLTYIIEPDQSVKLDEKFVGTGEGVAYQIYVRGSYSWDIRKWTRGVQDPF